jgi:transposase
LPLGIGIGKNSFHLIGLDARGAIVLRQKLSHGQVEARLDPRRAGLIGMEACVGAYHLSRQLLALRHDVKLIPAQFVPLFASATNLENRSNTRRGRTPENHV